MLSLKELKDTAFHLGGVTPEIFAAIQRVHKIYSRIEFKDIPSDHKWVGVGHGGTPYTAVKNGDRRSVSVDEVLGAHLYTAIVNGYTAYFPGDDMPSAHGHMLFLDGTADYGDVVLSALRGPTMYAYRLCDEVAIEVEGGHGIKFNSPIFQSTSGGPVSLDSPTIESKVLAAKVGAPQVLQAALGHMQDRATTYDSAAGERSMGKTVAMFNTLYGKDLTEEQGWAMVCLLKMFRSSQGDFRLDNYEDLAAYAGLMAEGAQ